MGALVCRALTGMNREARYVIATTSSGFASASRQSKPHRHPDMAALETQPLIEALRIDAGMVRQQFDQLAAPAPRLGHRPLHQLLADAAAAAMAGDANVLDQSAPRSLRTQSPQDAKLQAADHGALAILRDHGLNIRVAVERLEGLEIARRQRVFDPFAAAAERVVRQHPDNGADVVAARGTDGDGGDRSHDGFRQDFSATGGRP